MPAAIAAVDFHPHHAERRIAFLTDRTVDWLPEARPTSAAIKFCTGIEERLITSSAMENAAAFFLIEGACEGPLCGLFTQHGKLIGGQLILPFCIAQ